MVRQSDSGSHNQKDEPVLLRLTGYTPTRILELALGYRGRTRWLSLYWDKQKNCAIYADVYHCYVMCHEAWQIFLTRPPIKKAIKESPIPFQSFLLDRRYRKVYLCNSSLLKLIKLQASTLDALAEYNQYQEYLLN